eukprot:3519394-Rhodomonas_salina.1
MPLYSRYAMSGTDLAYGATSGVCGGGATGGGGLLPISLWTCYAMSGTSIASGAIFLRTRYAMSLTSIGYGAMQCPVLT